MRKLLLTIALIWMFSFRLADAPDYKMVTLFVYNFARNIQWPESSTTNKSFKIGVWGESAFYTEAKKFLRDKKIDERSIEVVQLAQINEINSCHLVFVAPEKMVEIKKLSTISASSSVLLVALHENHQNGIGINLFTDNQDHKMKFQLNDAVMKNKNIKVSKTLIDLAYH